MRTARMLQHRGSPWQRIPPWQTEPPPLGQRSRLERDPLDREPPWTQTPQPGHRPPNLDRDPSLWTESQTGVKPLPCRNFVAGGNKRTRCTAFVENIFQSSFNLLWSVCQTRVVFGEAFWSHAKIFLWIGKPFLWLCFRLTCSQARCCLIVVAYSLDQCVIVNLKIPFLAVSFSCLVSFNI